MFGLNFLGLSSGFIMLLVIGAGHILVVKGEYHFGVRLWPLFLILGLLAIAASLFLSNDMASCALGIVGFVLLWSIHELFKQKERVRKGWFPQNPKREE